MNAMLTEAGGPWGLLVLATLAGLATMRLVRLITIDRITEPVRSWAHKRDPQTKHLGYWVTCPYCVGIWAAALAWVLLALGCLQDSSRAGWLLAGPVLVLAVAQLGILISRLQPGEEHKTSQMAPWPEEGQ